MRLDSYLNKLISLRKLMGLLSINNLSLAEFNTDADEKKYLSLVDDVLDIKTLNEYFSQLNRSDVIRLKTIIKKTIKNKLNTMDNEEAEFISVRTAINKMLDYKIDKERENLIVKQFEYENKIERRQLAKQEQKLKLKEKSRKRKELLRRNKLLSAFLKSYRDLYYRFLEITERKVSLLDEYGSEQWDYLYREIAYLLTVLAEKREDYRVSQIKELGYRYIKQKNPIIFPEPYDIVASYLEAAFKKLHKNEPTLKISLSYVDNLSGLELESYISKLLRDYGIENIAGTPITGDQGADLIIKLDNNIIAIQVKKFSQPVGNRAIQEIVGALKYYNANEGWVITNSIFTKSAKELAQKNKIVLVDRTILNNFDKFISNYLNNRF